MPQRIRETEPVTRADPSCIHATGCRSGSGRKPSQVALVAALLVAPSGCIPSHLVVQQSESVTIVDATSRVPIAGAEVTVETWQVRTPLGDRYRRKYIAHTKTDGAGHFTIPVVKEWFAVVPIPDLPPAFNRRICIAEAHHEVIIADPWAAPGVSPWTYSFPTTYELRPLANPGTVAPIPCPF